jgi:hypothetical protein
MKQLKRQQDLHGGQLCLCEELRGQNSVKLVLSSFSADTMCMLHGSSSDR